MSDYPHTPAPEGSPEYTPPPEEEVEEEEEEEEEEPEDA